MVGSGEPLSPPARVVLKRLQSVVQGSHILKEVLPDIDFANFFNQKGVDYTGEEVRLAQPIGNFEKPYSASNYKSQILQRTSRFF